MAQALSDRRRRLAGTAGISDIVGTPAGTAAARPAATEHFQAILDLARTRAALSGSFSPDALFVGDVDEATRQLILSQLVPNVVTESPGHRWTLLNAPRAEILQGILSRREIGEKLAGPLPDTDSFGHTLRAVLQQGDAIDLPDQIPELLNLSKAIEAIAPLDVPKPDLNQLRQKIERASFLKDFDTLLGRGVIGRDKESADLLAWLTTRSTAPWDGLMLTGLGGAGKSTVLVSFLQAAVRNQHAVVALLDFDRPGVDATDTSWMEFEISRQVGYQFPDLGEGLRSVRQRLRDENQRPAQNADIEQASFQRTSRGLMVEMCSKLMARTGTSAIDPVNVPFVLALDTLETVVERGLQGKIIDWLYSLQYALSPFRLKVIFSGRMFEAADIHFQPVVQTRILLGELPAPDAQRLLEKFDVDTVIASRIANSDVLPRRPLELRLLAKLIHQDKQDSRTTDIGQLERELREGGPAAQALFAGLVYRRVLERLPEDSRARDLAYPGLVLRYLSAEILVEVLAPALGLQDMTLAKAQQALDDLARHDWLVYRKGDQLWHRSDLRRSTLVPMLSSSDVKVREIRKSAITFFERMPPSGTPSPERLGEAIYHRLMDARPSDDAHLYDLPAIQRLEYVFEQSIAELPPSGMTLLRLARDEPITAEGIHLLPGGFRPVAADGVGLRLVADRELGKAYDLHDHSRSTWSAATWEYSRRSISWRCEAAFGTAHWADLIHNLPPPPRDENDLESLGRLYPYELAGPADVSARDVAEWLTRDRLLLERPGKSLRPGTSDKVTRRIAIVTSLVNARDSFDARERRVLYELVNLFIKQRKGEVDDPALAWLAGIARTRKAYRMVMRTFNLCLDRTWLETFSEHARPLDPSSDAVKMAANIWSYMNAPSALGARKLLGDVDLLDSGKSRAYLKIDANDDEALWWLLRGPSPELRNPVRYALLERFKTRGEHAKLAEILQKHVDIEIVELQPGHFADAMEVNGEEALAAYVELVDRHWRLREFLDDCIEVAPGDPLEAVRDASRRWEDGVRIALLGAGAGLAAV